MNVRFINPFIESTIRVLKTMLKVDATIGKPTLAKEALAHDVSAIIGLSGDVVGNVVLCLPTPVATQLVGRFAGTEFPPDREEFADAIGELVNMIAGAAKAQFEGMSVSISCPSVVVGSRHTVTRPSDVIGIHIPCKVWCGDFILEITMKNVQGQTGQVAGSQKASAA